MAAPPTSFIYAVGTDNPGTNDGAVVPNYHGDRRGRVDSNELAALVAAALNGPAGAATGGAPDAGGAGGAGGAPSPLPVPSTAPTTTRAAVANTTPRTSAPATQPTVNAVSNSTT
ncbi:hypothetical protein HK102_013160, partial [Quaeritorhiza haematococci]